jgi:hypothetical protein
LEILNDTLLSTNKKVKEEVSRKTLSTWDENRTNQNTLDAAKAVLKRKYIKLNVTTEERKYLISST